MGPIALFDKSFLQSLSIDESVWFDHFFLAVVCPVFYVETLADLAKEPTSRGPAETAVRIIADKFPEMGGSPCGFHIDLCIGDLLGHHLPLDGRVPRSGGRMVKSGVIYGQAPAEIAFQRWRDGQFADVERLAAALWRRQLAALDLEGVAKTLRALGIDGKNCQSLEGARSIAQSVVNGTDKPYERLKLATLFLDIPQHLHDPIITAWKSAGQPPLATYAPYAAFVLTVEIFFQIALAARLISTDRPSNRTDIAYLFYLPFCMVFISSDKLHRRCAPLFFRRDQRFVWGPDLKTGLKAANEEFFLLPENEREKGVMTLGLRPPAGGIVEEVWKPYMRPDYGTRDRVPLDAAGEAKLLARFKAFRSEPPDNSLADDPEIMSIERRVRRRRGSWWQVPKDLPDNSDE
jgi:hypothetical protein